MSKLHEIARRAGVSRATVARVLARSNREIWPSAIARANRIRSLAQEMGYRPNNAAKAISTGRFNAVALVLSDQPGRGYLPPRLLRQIHDCLALHRFHLTYVRLNDAQLTDAEYLPDVLRNWSVDGLLVNYISRVPSGLSELLDRHSIPSIWLNHPRQHDCVYPNDEDAALRLTRHLIGLGHRDILYISPRPEPGDTHYSVEARLLGYKRAMREAGLTPREHTPPRSLTPQSAQSMEVMDASVELLSERGSASALITYSTQSALPLICAAARCGINVPRDLSIATFASDWHNEIAFPLTCALFPEELGERAVEMLLERIAHPDTPQPSVALHQPVVEGSTTGPRFALPSGSEASTESTSLG